MYIGIIGAMRAEVEKLCSIATDKEIKKIHSTEFTMGKIHGKDVVM